MDDEQTIFLVSAFFTTLPIGLVNGNDDRPLCGTDQILRTETP